MAWHQLGKSWQNPFLVTRKIIPLVYEIQKSQHSLPLATSVDHLKKYHGFMHETSDFFYSIITFHIPSTVYSHIP